jgi:hypothetical protein
VIPLAAGLLILGIMPAPLIALVNVTVWRLNDIFK